MLNFKLTEIPSHTKPLVKIYVMTQGHFEKILNNGRFWAIFQGFSVMPSAAC